MKIIGSIFLFLILIGDMDEKSIGNAEELGTVNWLRDYDKALLQAQKENKQVLILFQEVPGCVTCRNYGRDVLSNPLMVEAIEEYFIPLAIFNNKGGMDAEILKKYNEPSWNNPVVRIVDTKGEDVVNRLASNYSAIGLYESMKQALKKSPTSPAKYFQLLGEELEGKGHIKETYYKMYCFWSGEGHLGKKEGVISTEPGFMDGHEVVKVKYDERKLSKQDLDTYAAKASCSKISKVNGYRVDKDPQYYLKNSKYRYLPLSPIQRTKINSALADGTDPKQYLSPKQLKWLNETSAKKELLYEKSFHEAWAMRDR